MEELTLLTREKDGREVTYKLTDLGRTLFEITSLGYEYPSVHHFILVKIITSLQEPLQVSGQPPQQEHYP